MKIMQKKNPYDALASNILRSLKHQNQASPQTQKYLDSELDKLLAQTSPNGQITNTGNSTHPRAVAREQNFRRLETELNGFINELSGSPNQADLEAFCKKVLHWEQKVFSTQLNKTEKEILMAQGSLAKNFTTFLT